jgi:hypothetical protein
MHRAAPTRGHERGDARLLHHLGTLDRMLGDDLLPARARLEEELGQDLARILTAQLVSPPRRLAA